MRIYLLNAPFKPNFVRCGRWQGVAARGGTLYYPIWLAYATGLLEKNGHTVKLVDAVASKWNMETVINDILAFNPKLIVIDTNFSSLNNDIQIANILKEKSKALTVLVGPPASQFPDKILDAGVDFVARFEFDFTLLELAQAIETGESFNEINGLSYIENGIIQHNPNRDYTSSEDLDKIPFVTETYKKHLIIKNYFLSHAFYPMVQIITSRGCPNQCTFCSWPVTLTGRKYRMRSVENIVAEFAYIKNELPEVKEIFIEDDCFTINKAHVVEFCEQLQEKGIKISWGCQARATLDYDTMAVMKKAGCRLLDVGYESGNDKILKNIKKGISVDQLIEFTKNAKKAKLKILADFVVGFNGETEETAAKTMEFIHKVKPDLLQVAIATPIPGTDFFNFCKEKNHLLTSDLQNSIDSRGVQKSIVSYPQLTNVKTEEIVHKAIIAYYLNFQYFLIVLKNFRMKHLFNESKILLKSGIAFFKIIWGV